MTRITSHVLDTSAGRPVSGLTVRLEQGGAAPRDSVPLASATTDSDGRVRDWLPSGVAPPAPDSLAQWTEELWSRVGVVPRSRYQELLERYEALRMRLEEAEVTIQRLKRLLSEKGHEGDAQKLLDLWSNAVGETLRSQAEWMRTWIAGPGEADVHPPRVKAGGTTHRKRKG